MSSYHETLFEATKRAYLQTESLTHIFSTFFPAITQTVVEDSPAKDQLMEAANQELDEANQNLAEAVSKVKSARQKVLAATEINREQGSKLAAWISHMTEAAEQVIEHQDYAADVGTLAGGFKMLLHDEEFMTWLLNEADETRLNRAMEKLSHHRLGTVLLNAFNIANGPQLKWASLQMDEAKRNLITEIFQDILKDSEE